MSDLAKMVAIAKKFGGSGGGGGGNVQPDWNQTDATAADFIRNKPFGDSPNGGDTIAWDGNTDGLVNVGDFFFKVSDAVPTINDFADGAKFTLMGESFEIAAEEVTEMMEGVITYGDGLFVIVSTPGVEIGDWVFSEPGIYFQGGESGALMPALTIYNYTGFPLTKIMETKFLPDVFIQGDKFILLTSGGKDESKKFLLYVNDRAELQIIER